MVFDRDVAGQGGAVGQDAVVADGAVVADMGVGHDQAMAAHPGGATAPLVPREMVTHSRMVLSSPISRLVASPWYLRSWGATPRQAKEYTRFLAPRRVLPSSTTWETSSQSSPSSTSGPMVQ